MEVLIYHEGEYYLVEVVPDPEIIGAASIRTEESEISLFLSDDPAAYVAVDGYEKELSAYLDDAVPVLPGDVE